MFPYIQNEFILVSKKEGDNDLIESNVSLTVKIAKSIHSKDSQKQLNLQLHVIKMSTYTFPSYQAIRGCLSPKLYEGKNPVAKKIFMLH